MLFDKRFRLIKIRLRIRQCCRCDKLIFRHDLTVIRAVDFSMALHKTRFRVGDVDMVIRQKAPRAKDFPSERAYRNKPLTQREKEKDRRKSSVRALGENPFLITKRLWGFTKTRYRGLAKNTHWLSITCVLVNLYVKRRALAAA